MYDIGYVIALLHGEHGCCIGSVPIEEKCSQLGQRDFSILNEIETSVFLDMLTDIYPFTEFRRVKSFTDDDEGNKLQYLEIEVLQYENFEMPERWSAEAYKILVKKCKEANVWHPSFREPDQMRATPVFRRGSAAL